MHEKLNDELFNLVKSLSPTEKRYFKSINSQGNADKNYIRLFDAINNLSKPDDQKLIELFSGEKFVNHLRYEKAYLKSKILKALRLYHFSDRKNIEVAIREMIQDVEVLKKKGLYKQSIKILMKAKEMASKYEKWTDLLEILGLERLFFNQNQEKKILEKTEKLIEEMADASKMMDEENKYANYYYRKFALYREGSGIDQNRVEEINEPLQKPESSSFMALHYYFLARSLDLSFSGDKLNSFYEYSNLLNHWNGNLLQKKAQLGRYKLVATNCLSLWLGCGKEAPEDFDFKGVLMELESYPPISFDEKAEAFQTIWFLRFFYFLERGFLEELDTMIPEIVKGLEKYSPKINPSRRIAFIDNIFSFRVATGNYKEAWGMAEEILKDRSKDIRKDIQAKIQLLLPVIHLELGNVNLFESAHRSSMRYLKDWELLGEDEKRWMKFIKDYSKMKISSSALKEYYDTSEEWCDKQYLICFWLKSKIENAEIKEIYLSKQGAK